MASSGYRGRIAPSPTGLLHLGHAATFWTAHERAGDAGGALVFRDEDLDPQRSKPEYAAAMAEDLHWLGIRWQEGPYRQSERRNHCLDAWRSLVERGFVYPCTCSRRELAQSAQAPHGEDDGPLYPGTCRTRRVAVAPAGPAGFNWRFRVPDGEAIEFEDLGCGPQRYVAGTDFGDFLVWRRDDVPAYQLAVVADDAAMRITEVVRGADLLQSTARQLLLYYALETAPPAWRHCPLVTDANGQRLAKRHDALSLRAMRERGMTPEQVRALFPDRI